MSSYFPMVKNTAQRIVFPILDADGDPVTGAASDTPDSEYSLDGGGFGDITDEIHEIATNSGVYYLDLLTGETNGDVVAIQIKTATAGTKTTILVFYTSAQSLDTIDTNIDDIETLLGVVDGKVDTIDTVADGIKSVTDNLPNSGALSDLAAILTDTDTNIPASLVTIAAYIDTEVAAIITDLNNATDGLGALKTLIDNLQTQVDTTGVALLAGAVDDIWDEVLTGAVHNDATSAGRRLRVAGSDVLLVRENTCQGGASASTVVIDSGASGTNNFYDHMTIILTDNTGAGQIRMMHNYVGNSFTADVVPDWVTTPDDTTEYMILAVGTVHVHEITDDGLAQINAEVDRALVTTTYAEPSSVPSATSSLKDKISWLFTLARNKITQTSATQTLRNDVDGADIASSTVSDDGTTATRGKFS